MSEIVKASIIIGVAIFLSQGIYTTEVSSTSSHVLFKINKLTGSSEICAKYKDDAKCFSHK